MNAEYEPTAFIGQSPSGASSSRQSDGEYEPTQRVDTGAGRVGASVSPEMAKTMQLKKEPPTFAWLVIVDGIHTGHIFHLHPETVIGRDPVCDIVLDDPAISRQHIKIRRMDGEDGSKDFVLQDLFTENGTLVNGEEVVKQTLTDGDRVLLGETKLVFKQVRL
jgi:hypothetical protein